MDWLRRNISSSRDCAAVLMASKCPAILSRLELTSGDCFVGVTAISNRLGVSIRHAVGGDPFGFSDGPAAGVRLAGEEPPGGAALGLARYLRCRAKTLRSSLRCS